MYNLRSYVTKTETTSIADRCKTRKRKFSEIDNDAPENRTILRKDIEDQIIEKIKKN